MLHNPHLDGTQFFLDGGSVGVLLIHGLTATTVEVRGLAEALNARGYTVSGPLLPGHGTTVADCNATGWREWLAAMRTAYETLAAQCDTVFVGGESTGAVIALKLAAEYPDIIGVLTYAPAIRINVSRFTVAQMRVGHRFIESVPKGSIDSSGNWQGYAENPVKAGLALIDLQKVVTKNLRKVKQPILIVHGRNDTTVPYKAGDIIRKKSKAAFIDRYMMENSSHVVLLDDELPAITAHTESFMFKALNRQR